MNKSKMIQNLDKFTGQYLVTALWSSADDEGNPMDDNHDLFDLSEEAINKAIEDCRKFQEDNAALLEGYSLSTAGHDFWLTRNGHGAGFWDGDYEKDVGDKLTVASKSFGEIDLYVGDDGELYFS